MHLYITNFIKIINLSRANPFPLGKLENLTTLTIYLVSIVELYEK